ncbi:MAG: ATP-binding cassette domain-containing protein [Desulfobacteraceae bacterium]
MKIRIQGLSFRYKRAYVLERFNLDVPRNCITAVSGPSGAGKTTLLFCLNRLWEGLYPGNMEGRIRSFLDNEWVDIYDSKVSLPWLRQKTGMVFQSPNPFPMSIRDNLLFPLKLAACSHGKRTAAEGDLFAVLKKVYLYDEVKERMEAPAACLSGGQQQRLCIARALMANPEILLLDEPTSSLDPVAEERIETLLTDLKSECTIVMVSHSESQIRRVADIRVRIHPPRPA